jgi:integrase
VARRRTGELIWRKASGRWSGRYYAPDGKRRCVPLGTDNAAIAKRKLERIVAGELEPGEGIVTESFREAAARVVPTSASDRVRRLKAFAYPILGMLSVERIGRSHVREALKAAVQAGASHGTVLKLRSDISAVLGELCADDVLPTNAALQLKVPEGAKDERPRVVLTDDEFERFTVSCQDAELLVLAIVSRCLGGMRTSDLHAWDWRHIDLDGWETAHVPRPKTKSSERHALPAEVVPTLQAWWRREGQPRSGPVFPVRVGKRARERKRGKISYAERLRTELLRAGLDRHELHHDTEHTRRVDFHSCRRAYATGLATAGVNLQTAMRLAGHRNPSTHQRYVSRAEVIATPAAALPNLKARLLPIEAMLAKRRTRKSRESPASPARVELATNALGKRCSIQLSYGDLGPRLPQNVASLARNWRAGGAGREAWLAMRLGAQPAGGGASRAAGA